MRDGKVLQIDRPKELYERPNNLFIAAFIGSPTMNLVHATVDADGLRFGQFHVPFADGSRPDGLGDVVVLGIRPEVFEDAAFAPGLPTISVSVEVLEELGSDAHVFFHVDASPISAEIIEAGEVDGLPDGRALFTARVDAQSTAQVGETVELALDPRRFHFFDPESGARLSGRGAAVLAGAR